MYHSITFGTKNTWDDWRLIPTSRPVVNPPAIKTHVVDIPGSDGSLDLTEALLGRPLFQNRTGSFEFAVDPDFKPWHVMLTEIMLHLHGQEMSMILEDDPNYYYEGRFTVNDWKSSKDYSTVVIDYNVRPYKKDVHLSGDDWLWDTFNFKTGVIRRYKNIPINGTVSVPVTGGAMPATPSFISSADGVVMTWNGTRFTLKKGVNFFDTVVIMPGENEFVFQGSGVVTVEYQGGTL